MHEQQIITEIMSRLCLDNCIVLNVSLVCGEKILKKRLLKDVESGLRTEDIVERSIKKSALYEKLNTVKVDVSEKSPEEAAEEILSLMKI